MTDLQTITSVIVVIPAHNEDRHIGKALAALKTAADALQRERPGTSVSIVVVLDCCTDRSADITAAYVSADPRFGAVDVKMRSTGASRDAGIRAALDRMPGDGTATTWLATTDADSAVPEHWLVRQVELANAGADAILGSVEPDPDDVDPAVLRRWLELHPFREDHPHIYGANLGIRASAYLAAGGFPKVRAHEDRVLVEQLRGQRFVVTATDTTRVVTSGRMQARAPEGFAAYLRTLGAELPAATG
ncbi:glycosyltransferase [Arthrobacter sp. AK01]|uniref:glycosyltransferase n=1 Tax=Micrococcaceae TaxID=1268 RepID=UPI001E42A148|nr:MULTISPECIES: glycosyltransferase [Micrococcaceae]MCD4853567.1 glycosyltransferase [Arthrobacter sp. AK01]MCP1410759.1 glycosyltransferase involved in cell wall biosynthesis [Paenarthrobacter sp. A20]